MCLQARVVCSQLGTDQEDELHASPSKLLSTVRGRGRAKGLNKAMVKAKCVLQSLLSAIVLCVHLAIVDLGITEGAHSTVIMGPPEFYDTGIEKSC